MNDMGMSRVSAADRAFIDQLMADGMTSARFITDFGRGFAQHGDDAVFLRVTHVTTRWFDDTDSVATGAAARMVAALVTELLRARGEV